MHPVEYLPDLHFFDFALRRVDDGFDIILCALVNAVSAFDLPRNTSGKDREG